MVSVSLSGGATKRLETACSGGNVASDAEGTFVIDVAAKEIWREQPEGPSRLVEKAPLSGLGMLDREHLHFTTGGALCRVPRKGGGVEVLAEGEEPAILGAVTEHIVFTLGSFFDDRNEVFVVAGDGRPAKRFSTPPVLPGCIRLCGERLVFLLPNHRVVSIHLRTGKVERLGDLLTVPEYARFSRRRPFLHADDRSIYFSGVSDGNADLLCRWSLANHDLETLPVPRGAKVESSATRMRGTGHYWLLSSASGKSVAGWSSVRPSSA